MLLTVDSPPLRRPAQGLRGSEVAVECCRPGDGAGWPSPRLVSQTHVEARAAGAAPVGRGDPGSSRKFDRDSDGIGCE